MYIVDSFTGPQAKDLAIARRPFGPGFNEEEIPNIHSIDVLGTSCNDPGPDYCDFVVKDTQGTAKPTPPTYGRNKLAPSSKK